MKKHISCSVFIIFILSAGTFGQNRPDTFEEKVKKLLDNYAASYNTLADENSDNIKKKAAVLIIKNSFESMGTYVFDDIAYIKDDSKQHVKVGEVFKNIDSYFPMGHKVLFNTSGMFVGEQVKNYKRNSLTTEVKVKKKITFREERSVTDSIIVDTVSGDTSIISHNDTVLDSEIVPLSFILKYDIENGQLVNLKIDAISLVGFKHKFKELSGDDEWWVGLDKEWKTYFVDEVKMPEFPDKYDFTKLEYLTKIDLSGKQFSTYEPLKKLKGIQVLDLSKSNFNDVGILKHLKGLRSLDLSESGIKEINEISGLTNLQFLKLNKLELESIDPLKSMVNLLELEIKENKLENINAVSSMEKLEKIDFSLNLDIETIQPLSGLENLTNVKFAKMKVKDLTPLSNCPNLVELDCFNNEITSLKPIASCYKITTLNIGYNKIYTLDELAGMKYVIILEMRGAPVEDISVCRNFRHLETVDLSETNVTNLTPLFSAENILKLTMIDSKVSVSEKDRFKKRFPKCRLTYY